MALPEDIQRASVIALCANPVPANIVSQYGKRVIKISDHEVVKWGPDITKEEADNQRIAYGLVNSRIVRVPRVYDFFSDKRGWGYIVMEYIEGRVIHPLEDSAALQKVVDVLDYFATLRHTNPGSLCGGPCRGLLFPETEDLLFDDLDEMEKWFNSRLLPDNPKLSFQGCNLVLCHLDIAPRNIL
ncbi:kinase-like protein [Penicillium hordei]|uniref:Kinase-like protein n=1 Tax=Penicillium hordei TaxID=40994 RepID=A0AAD6H6Z8_9EURO|nr:kinase-like protein [Penicillium hordei]KAJ5617371.1 kinase-like protein [Penicillium hordei]